MAATHLAVLDGDICLALSLLAVCCCHIGVELLLRRQPMVSQRFLRQNMQGMMATQTVALQKQVRL